MRVSGRTEAKTWIVFDTNGVILLLTLDEQEADAFVTDNSTIATKKGPYHIEDGEVPFKD